MERESTRAFECTCDELISSKFIMSAQKIKNLLKCVAYYEDLRTVVEQSKLGFDYSKELAKAMLTLDGKNIFKLPSGSSKILALVTCMLLDFDADRLDITKFIKDFYPSLSHNLSFKTFCTEIIEPYRKSMLERLEQSHDNLVVDIEHKADEAINLVNEAIIEQSEQIIAQAISLIKGADIGAELRSECLLMLEGYIYSLETRDERKITIAWIGLKNTLSQVKTVENSLDKLKEVLKMYLVC